MRERERGLFLRGVFAFAKSKLVCI